MIEPSALVDCVCLTASVSEVQALRLDGRCAICNVSMGRSTLWVGWHKAAPELVAAYRVGGLEAVDALVLAHPRDYPVHLARMLKEPTG